MDKIDDPSRISRISPGIGYSDHAAPSTKYRSSEVFFESTFDYVSLNDSLKIIQFVKKFFFLKLNFQTKFKLKIGIQIFLVELFLKDCPLKIWYIFG